MYCVRWLSYKLKGPNKYSTYMQVLPLYENRRCDNKIKPKIQNFVINLTVYQFLYVKIRLKSTNIVVSYHFKAIVWFIAILTL